MSRPSNRCPNCNAEGTLEFFGQLWLDDLVIQENPAPKHWGSGPWYQIVDAAPATVADDDTTGIVWTSDDSIACKNCDARFATNHGDRSRAFFERFKMVSRATVSRRRRRNRTT